MGQHNATITGKAYIFAIKLYPSNASRSNYDTVPASLGTIFTPAFTRNWAIETLCLFSQSRTGTRVGNIRMLQYDDKLYGINLKACSLRSPCSISLHIKNFLGSFLLGRRKYKYIIATILHEQDQQIKWTRTNQTPDSPIEFPVTKFSNHKIKDSINCVLNKRGTDALAKYTDSLERKVALYIGNGKMHWRFDD